MIDPTYLVEQIRAAVDYIDARTDVVPWGRQLAAFGRIGAQRARAIESALAQPTTPPVFEASGEDVRATARIGDLLLTAAGIGAGFNGMTATWAPGEPDPATITITDLSVEASPVGYLAISGAPTTDFNWSVEITSTGGIGVGSYRFAVNGGAWSSPATIPESFTHEGVTIGFMDELTVPGVPTPFTSNYVAGASASWQSRGFDRLTLQLGEVVEVHDFLLPGDTAFADHAALGASASRLVAGAAWESLDRPQPQTVTFAGGDQRVVSVGEAPESRLAAAVAAGDAWLRRWVLEISDHVVTRAQTAPAALREAA